MKWSSLLCKTRARELLGGSASARISEETRDEFERDYGRSIFSTPVRRLQDKAQVFPLEPIDAVRTRLTHSLEVSSVARGIASGLARTLMEKLEKPEFSHDIETTAATSGLLHDVGNPPFGHAGEEAIREWFKRRIPGEPKEFAELSDDEREDLLHFEGNAQTLRLLTKLQILSDRYGLNLTAGTLSALCKYTANSLELKNKDRPRSKKKLGYFTSESPIVSKIRDITGTGDARHPIAILVEAADDIVYSVVDIEDGIKKGVIRWSLVRELLDPEVDEIGKELFEECIVGAQKKVGSGKFAATGQNRDEGISQYFRTLVIGKASAAVQKTFMKQYDEIMSGNFNDELLYRSQVGPLYNLLKNKIGVPYVYASKETLRLELLGCEVIHSLMDIFWKADNSANASKFGKKTYALLSKNYRTIYERPDEHVGKLSPTYQKALLITDYICGMTDSFAVNLHNELRNG